MLPNFEMPVVQQPRTAIVEAVKIVLDRVHTQEHACAQCILGMLLDELGFQEREFVAAGIGLSCIYATKTAIDWNALMTEIEIKRRGCLSITKSKAKAVISNGIDINAKTGNKHPYWLSESLKMKDLKEKLDKEQESR